MKEDKRTFLRLCVAITAALATVQAVPLEPKSGCDYVGSWGEWSECKGSSRLSDYVPETKVMTDELKAEGKGRKAMQRMMQAKREASKERMQCHEDSSCHEVVRESRAAAECTNGMAGGYPCRNVHLKSFINFVDLGFTDDIEPGEERSGNDIWGWTDPQDGEEYAIMGMSGGSSFIRVNNGDDPEVLGFLPTHTDASLWRDMKVVNDYAFIVSEAAHHGMQIVDLTQLRGLSADPSHRITASHYDGVGSSHNIVGFPEQDMVLIVGATQVEYYSTNCRGGLHMIDVKDPKNPKFLGCWGDDAYIHDAHCLTYPDDGPDASYRGKDVCFNFAEDSFAIVDITHPSSPTRVSRVFYTGCFYSHQGWASEDLRLVLLDDELDERESLEKYTQTYVFDITDMQNPVVTQRYTSSQTSIDHNQYIIGSYSHQSNYEAGYRLLEIDTTNPKVVDEVAYFDIYPSRTGVAFEGTWSNYPWFENGIIPVSSINDGLYIIQVDWASIQAEKEAKVKYQEMQRFREVSGKDDMCPEAVQTMQC